MVQDIEKVLERISIEHASATFARDRDFVFDQADGSVRDKSPWDGYGVLVPVISRGCLCSTIAWAYALVDWEYAANH